MTWFLSDDVPEIPADILERLNSRFDLGDCGDVAEAERERSSVRRVVAINQQLRWQLVEVTTDLVAERTNVGYLRDYVQDLVKVARRLGYAPSPQAPSPLLSPVGQALARRNSSAEGSQCLS